MPAPPRAIILAAGEGKRMRPLTANRPKVLLPVAGVPLVERLVVQLAAAGVTDITFVVHDKEAAVREHFGDGSRFGVKASYARQEKPLGTGDAVRAAGVSGDVLVLNGDLLVGDDALAQVLAAGEFVVTAKRVKDPSAYGVFEVRGDDVLAVAEKTANPPSELANAGIYRFPPEFFKHLESLEPSARGELELTDALNAFIAEAGPAKLVELAEWFDVGRPWDILAATEHVLRNMKGEILGTVEPGCTLKGEVHVARGAVLKSGTYVEGPAWIGEDSVLGPNCYIRPFTAVGRRCKVGNACEIKASVMMDGAHAGHLTYLGDSIVGANANLGAGTLVANLRHDSQTVKVTIEGTRLDTGRRKMGVILGDDVHTGINTSLNVGVVLPAGASTNPGQVVMRSPE